MTDEGPVPEPQPFHEDVLERLHEVAAAAREVPTEHQPERLRDALTSLVAIDVISAGTIYLDPTGQAGVDVSP